MVGGGIGGAAFAHYFSSLPARPQGCPSDRRRVVVFEASADVGGRLSSVVVDGVKVELGGTFCEDPDACPALGVRPTTLFKIQPCHV